MDFIKAIRDRREKSVSRALAMLEIYGASDTNTRLSLLGVAAKSLPDSRVVLRWMALLASESDPGVRECLLQEIGELDFRQAPDGDFLPQLLACVEQPDSREWALYCISRIAPHDPRMIQPLIAAYRAKDEIQFRKNILATLAKVHNPSPELIQFFISVLNEVDETLKTELVRRLLDRDGLPATALEILLAPTEPSNIKVLVLAYLIDRSIPADARAIEILRRDPDPACRYAAAWALTENGSPPPGVLAALLDAAKSDPDDGVREFAIAAFEHTLAKTPEVIAALIEALRRETSAPRVQLILRLLEPHLQRSPEVVSALIAVLEQNIQTEIAVEMYAKLGALAPWNPALMDWLIAACKREKDDRVKAAILKPLAKYNFSDARVAQLCADALKLPDPAIQHWGLRGLLLLPVTPENIAAIMAGAALLLSRDIPLSTRTAFANKLAAIPDKTPELLARMKQVAEQSPDVALKKIGEDACNQAAYVATDPSEVRVDWAEWIHRAEVEHRGNGIFPAIYEHFDEAPDSARRVLKALLNPQCEDNLYSCYGYDVNEGVILNYLDRKNAVDDDISRHCVGRIQTQTAGTPDGYLQCLASNPHYAPLKDDVFKIVEIRADASPALLRQILVVAYGDHDLAAQALAARIKRQSARTLKPYVRLILQNLAWAPASELLTALSEHPALTGDSRTAVMDALKRFAPSEPPKPSTPAQKREAGFADE